jgi:hypothetical protein
MVQQLNEMGPARKAVVFWTTVGGVVLVALVVVGGWQAGWWFHGQNVNRTSRLYQHSYGRQTALRDDISTKLGTVADITVQLGDTSISAGQRAALKAQRLAVVRIVCQDAEQVNTVTDLPPDQQTFVGANCTGGDVSTGSEYRR